MTRTNRDANRWVVDLLGIEAGTRVLEVGCGPGAGLAEALARGAAFVGGVDDFEGDAEPSPRQERRGFG